MPVSGVDAIRVTVSVNGSVWNFDDVYCFSDRDADSVLDWIEFREGMNTHSMDSDSDGLQDREEVVNSLHPTKPLERGLEKIEKSTSLVLSFPTRENIIYTIYGTSDFRDWIPLAPDIAGTGDTSHFFLDTRSSLDHRFYTLSRKPDENLPQDLFINSSVTSINFFSQQGIIYQFLTEDAESGNTMPYGKPFSGSGRIERIQFPESAILKSFKLQQVPVSEWEGISE